MDRYLNLVELPAKDLDAAGPKGFQAMLLGPSKTGQVCHFFLVILVHKKSSEFIAAISSASSTLRFSCCTPDVRSAWWSMCNR